MKVLGAAVAAIVIVGSVVSGVPAFAASTPAPSVDATSTDAGTPIGVPFDDGHAQLTLPTPSNSSAARLAPDAAPDAAPADASSVTVSGVVTYGSGAAGHAEVYAQQVDPVSWKEITETKTIAAADGSFRFTSLVAGSYVFSFYYDGAAAGETAMWWNATGAKPHGSGPTALAAGASLVVNQLLVPTATVTGTVLTGHTAQPLKPSDVEVILGVFNGNSDAGGKYYNFEYGTVPAADGTFEIDFVLPFTDVALFADYSGTDSFAARSASPSFSVSGGLNSGDNVIVKRVIPGVAGVNYPTNAVVSALYWDFMTRQPGASEISFWNNQFSLGRGLGDVSQSFENSDEYRLIRIDAAYQTILGRGPDPKGRADWLRWMQQGIISTDDIETSLYSSQEYFQNHGNTNPGFMAAIYTTLLHRAGSSADYTFWSNLIDQHGRAWVVAQFWSSTETIRERVSLMYAKYLGRTPDPSGLDHWVGEALALGDSGLRSGLTGNQEYLNRSVQRFTQG